MTMKRELNIYLLYRLILQYKEGVNMLREAGVEMGDEDDLR